MTMRRVLWFVGALAGVVLAAGVTYAASSLSSPRVGLSGEPPSAGADLAPRATVTPKPKAKPKRTATPKPKRKPRATPRPAPTTVPVPTAVATAAPTVDDHGGGSGGGSSGKGSSGGGGRDHPEDD
jgi:outer membrane biosynthesis protein TonB